MDFSYTRAENDQNLLARSEAIRKGEDLQVLEPFARAYLGLFYDIDNQLVPSERIDLLANSELSTAIKQGLCNLLHRADMPGIDAITQANLKQENLSIGFAVLAGISLCAEDKACPLLELPAATLKAAICFHHFISTFHEDDWYKPLLLARPELAAETLLTMWQTLISNKQDFLPGMRPILEDQELAPIRRHVIVPLLKIWKHCRHRDLLQLLSLAFIYADSEQLRDASTDMLTKGELLPLRNQVYWQTTAFLLAPEQQGQAMLNFMGQEKIKLLPMLDFIIPLLDNKQAEPFKLSATGYGYLIRCLAQKFTPQVDMYDNLADISLKVLWLFYKLACFSEVEGGKALADLRKVRVLKLYSDIFDAVAHYQAAGDKPEFQVFVQSLRDEGRLRMKKNWHDGR